MTLTTHAVVGAAIVSIMPQHPIWGVCAAIGSHFVIDAIPHWDYPIASASINPNLGLAMKYDRAFYLDVVRIGADALLGVVLSLLLFSTPQTQLLVFIGAGAGILPDPLQFVYTRYKHEPLVSLQRFHQWIHTKNHMKKAKFFGIISQIIFIVAVIAVVRIL